MDQSLTDDEFEEQLRSFSYTAFRLESQPAYNVPYDLPWVERYLAGDLTPPVSDDVSKAWFAQVREQAADGKRMERVRVIDEPPTDYQRWLRWSAQWNIAAGEHIRYVTRRRAHEVGLLPEAGDSDWWLLDSSRLLVVRYDDEQRPIEIELTDDPVQVVRACGWRDLAIHHSVPEE